MLEKGFAPMADDLLSLIEKKSVILFDLFHTLVSIDAVHLSGPGTSELLGVSTEEWNRQLLECSNARLVGEISDPYDIIRRMAHAIDPEIPEETILHAADRRMERFANAIRSVSAMTLDVLNALRTKGKRLALISNADVTEVTAWDESPIAELFDTALFSCHLGHVKPDPKIYNMAMDQLGVESNECVFVGDGGSNELAGARNCAITTVMMTGIIKDLWPEKIDERKPDADFVIEDLNELVV